MKKLKLTVLPGDGVGRDVLYAALPIFDTLNVPVDFLFGEIGWECWKYEGNPVPERTWELIKTTDATLLGAITSKPEREAFQELSKNVDSSRLTYVSPVVQLRQKLDLFVNIRPCFNSGGSDKEFRFCIIRENTEGLYAGFDFYPIPEALRALIRENPHWNEKASSELSCSLRIQSEYGLKRLFEYAFAYADRSGFKRVTLADKPNVLRKSGVLARKIFENISEQYPHIQADIRNVDAVALWLVRRPEDFGVIVAENMFGDILSDLGAGMIGGLGFAPSANIGTYGCYFEPVHGSAPGIKSNLANPSAMFLTIGLLLEHFGYQNEADRIKLAVRDVVKEDLCVTYDLHGNATTEDMANAIIKRCCYPLKSKYVSFLTTGDEIVNGEIQDSNMFFFAKKINDFGGVIYQHIHTSDKKSAIERALNYLLSKSDAVIITGGLGPTSDDQTRFAVSSALKKDFIFNEAAWKHIVERLQRFNIEVDETNRQQAMLPSDGTAIQNENGTALGCHLRVNDKDIFMLPGPPKESQPMFIDFVIPILRKLHFFEKRKIYRWLTLGLIESNIAPRIDKIALEYSLKMHYRWTYPYLEIKLIAEENGVSKCIGEIEKILAPNLVSKNDYLPVELFQAALKNFDFTIHFFDDITRGCFENHMKEINLPVSLIFGNEEDISKPHKVFFLARASKIIQDQKDFSGTIFFQCSGYLFNEPVFTHGMQVPNRGPEIVEFANAYLMWQLYRFIIVCKDKKV